MCSIVSWPEFLWVSGIISHALRQLKILADFKKRMGIKKEEKRKNFMHTWTNLVKIRKELYLWSVC